MPATGVRLATALLAAATAAAADTAPPTSSQKARRTPIVEVFERTRDAVVSIQATQIVERRIRFSPFDELFNMPWGDGGVQRYQTSSLGSGFVVHADGYVVTNAHVIMRSAAPKVIFADKAEYEAKPIAIDERHDLAILKIQPNRSLPTIKLGRSDDLMIGETVIAIGNPLGYEHTVTAGIVSATNRTLNVKDDVVYTGLIQTDASINPGNSGGPLLNVLGELIGINTAIRGDAQNIGFAIAVDSLRKLLPDMLSVEQRKRLQVGLRLSWRDRVYVVEATGPAAEAGIEPGDELVSLDGTPIHQDVDFYIHLLRINADDRIRLELKRSGKRVSATVRPRPIPIPDGAKLLAARFGVVARLLTQEEAQGLGLPRGLIITDIERGSPADRAGFVRHQIVVQIDRYFPSDLEEVGLLLERVKPGDKVLFRVYEIHKLHIELLEGRLVAR